ncbi:hypothetical protein EPUS_05816 [Endocarpon pusillum Z07020]|uniref:Protein transport protein sec73 n=1 Tax=Endocarpon pusillum (strain Z07020 / HMAS-L-300199) TaxID=1263415 RepID=U1GHT7_ENDPU|nr:uncharacterized protein EPUS_05816 [Endocarpon pusillum Z07020]ERF77247.1 hypothetical protein EPUS_05816 [Endocarpon pusillum Z07020]
MPWKGLRSHAAGGIMSGRHSFLEQQDTHFPEGHETVSSSEPIAQQTDTTDDRPISQPSSDSISENPIQIAQATPSDVDQTRENVPQRTRNGNAATVPRSHRFSLLRLRHASDPQLSKSYNTSASSQTPPLPVPTTPTIVTTPPTVNASNHNKKIKEKLKLTGRSQNPSTENVALRRQSFGVALGGALESNSKLHMFNARNANKHHPHISFEEPNRLSAVSARGAPPAYGDVANSSLSLPPSRLSESSRSDGSSGEHGIYAETTTTHTVSTTTTFFRLPRRKKNKGHLFPLPVKPSQESKIDGIRTPRLPDSGRTSMSPGRRQAQDRGPVTAIYAPKPCAGSGLEHPSPLPSPTHSAIALTNAPLSSTTPSLIRKDSITSYRSAKSSPSMPMPPALLGSRGRSSTMGSLKKAREAEQQSSPQVALAGRTSTSTSGRKSFGDIFSLSQRLRQNSEPSNFGNGKTLSGAPGTPASTGSKSNSFQIPREPVIYPERAEGDTPATYLAKLEEAVNRGVIAAILCKGFDEFSKVCFRKYMRGFSYFGDSIDMAVRKMLMQVELPKETQQIDRLLQGFADRYCECNPGIFATVDEAYFVAFSILLLHSDTHNKNNKRKMQKADYVKNTQDQVEVSHDILECFYDNVSYTPFIHFEDEVAINSHRLGAPKPKKGLFKTPSNDNLRGPVDPYALILDQKLELLRPSLKDVMDTEDTYSYTGTVSSLDANGLYQAFHKAGVLQIVSARSRPDAFLSQATISNPAEAQAGLVDIKAAKVGLLWRKDPKKKKARSPWQEWGAILTGSQLYFFKDVTWIKSLIFQNETQQKSGADSNPIIFKPPLSSFQPDALLSMDDAVALHDAGYKKHKHAFLFVKHGGFEEVFLANSEGDMNDWIAKLNYAATFRTAGVRMRGFIGANYEGQRPELCRNDSATSTRSGHAISGEVHAHGRHINQQLAREILAYRRQIMTDRIAEANDKLATAQKELDNLLRNARHLQICSPIQAKSREALVLAAGRMSAKLKWTRVDMWRTRCHRDVMKMDLEQEIGLTSAASILRESVSLRSTPQKRAPLKLSSQSLKKSDTKSGDAAASPKSTYSVLSAISTSQAMLDKARTPDGLRHALSDDSVSRGHHSSIGSVEQFMAASGNSADAKNRASSLSVQSPSAPSLDHRPSTSGSQFGRSDADSIARGSRLTTPTPSVDDEERLLREAGILDVERTLNALRRPGTSESDPNHPTVTSPDALPKDRTGVRRSLHRTLRDSQHGHHGSQSVRLRKAKEPAMHSSPAALRRSSQSGAEGLTRGTGSFIVHGKKASVITFGSEWQSMSNEDRIQLRKQSQPEEREADAGAGSSMLLSPKAEEMEEAHDDTPFDKSRTSIHNSRDMKLGVSTPLEADAAGVVVDKDNLDRDHTTDTEVKDKTQDEWFVHNEGVTGHRCGHQAGLERSSSDCTAADHLSTPPTDLRRSPTPQAVHA